MVRHTIAFFKLPVLERRRAPRMQSQPTTLTFDLAVAEEGNYSVIIHTPGCEQDSTCASRGVVNVSGTAYHTAGFPSLGSLHARLVSLKLQGPWFQCVDLQARI